MKYSRINAVGSLRDLLLQTELFYDTVRTIEAPTESPSEPLIGASVETTHGSSAKERSASKSIPGAHRDIPIVIPSSSALIKGSIQKLHL